MKVSYDTLCHNNLEVIPHRHFFMEGNPSNVLLKVCGENMFLSIMEDAISFDDRYFYQLGIIGG